MDQQNITQDSTERFVPAQYILSDGTIETYSNYVVSDRGRVASLVNNYGHKRHAMKIKNLIARDKLGHLESSFYINGKQRIRSVHRMVLSSFHPELYFSGAEVDHLDRDVTNNHLDNLRWTDKNGNNANRALNPLKRIRVTHLDDGRIEEFDNMRECSRAFGKSAGWCDSVIILLKGFNKKLNILIEKI